MSPEKQMQQLKEAGEEYISIKTKGNSKLYRSPDECVVTNRKTGDSWSVKFTANTYTGCPEARLSDGEGRFLEKWSISRGRANGGDWIDVGCSPYQLIWKIVDNEFQWFQKEHCGIVESDSRKRRETTDYLQKILLLNNHNRLFD